MKSIKTPAYKASSFRWSLNDAVLQIYCKNSSRWHSGKVAQHTKEKWTNMSHAVCSHWRATADRNFDSETLQLWQWQCLQVRLMLHICTVRWAAVTGPSKLMTMVSADESCLRYFSTHKLKQLTDLICYQWLPICATWKHVAHSQNCTDAEGK